MQNARNSTVEVRKTTLKEIVLPESYYSSA